VRKTRVRIVGDPKLSSKILEVIRKKLRLFQNPLLQPHPLPVRHESRHHDIHHCGKGTGGGHARINENIKLSLWQKIQLAVQGYAFHHWEKRPGWRDYLPIYVVKCKKHGLYFDYPHGFRQYFLCPECWKEWRRDK